MDTSGTYSIQEHLMAMKAGYKTSRLSKSLKENIEELKFNRNSSAQKLVNQLLQYVTKDDTIDNKDKIEHLIDLVNADKVVNNTPHTFDEQDDTQGGDQFI